MKNELVDRENYTVTRNIICNIRRYDHIRRIRWDRKILKIKKIHKMKHKPT